MIDLRQAAEMAWNYFRNVDDITVEGKQVMEALRQALAQPEQEPVDWEAVAADQAMTIAMLKLEKRKWVNASHIEIGNLWAQHREVYGFAMALDALLKEKNHESK